MKGQTLACVFLACWMGCAGDKEIPAIETSDTDDVPLEDTSSATTDPSYAPVGYDVRPANPTCVAPEPPVLVGDAVWRSVFPGISINEGTSFTHPPGDDGQWWVTSQPGQIYRFDTTALNLELVADLAAVVNNTASEEGLLSLVFHPNYDTNGYVYIYYTNNRGGSQISRLISNDGLTLDPSSETLIFEVNQPNSNHNGGELAFGPDGYLYLGLGDGGGSGDQANRAQDPEDVLGKVLRFDVDSGTPYANVPTNPYALGGGRPEIFARGLRNPYRMSFDRDTGLLYAGDVGQDEWEEVNRIDLGGNLGWRLMEGTACFNPIVDCDPYGLTDPPIVAYPHTLIQQSVVFGGIYRGSALGALNGNAIYTDFYSGGDTYAAAQPPPGSTDLWTPTLIAPGSGQVFVDFAEDEDGELFALDYFGGFFALEPDVSVGVVDDFPTTLSATGCFASVEDLQMASGVIPYELSWPFWSDGASKSRWLALPDGTSMTVTDDGDLDFPLGSMLIKHFERDGARIETRFYMLHPEGNWAGYSYQWNDAQTEAYLVEGQVDLVDWVIPDRQGCQGCHTAAAGRSLGLELMQLAEREVFYPQTGRRAPQLDTWSAIGLLQPVSSDVRLPSADDDDATTEQKAKAWLHSNCSSCHRPNHGIEGDMDLRYETPLAQMNICGIEPTHGELDWPGSKLLTPSDPGNSILYRRSTTRGEAYQMPPIGSLRVDPAGQSLLSAWISELTECP